MTRKEKEKLLLDALGLKVGDVVCIKPTSKEYEIEESDTYFELNSKENLGMSISILLHFDFEKIVTKKKKGELKCYKMMCSKCPLYSMNCGKFDTGSSLYAGLESMKDCMPCKVYEEYKKVLDEEVEE